MSEAHPSDTPHRRTGRSAVAVISLAIAVLITACGGGGSDRSSSDESGTSDTGVSIVDTADTALTDALTDSGLSTSDDTLGPDTGSSDTGSTDTGSTDTGSTDTGSTDTGSTDSADIPTTSRVQRALLHSADVSRFTVEQKVNPRWDRTLCRSVRLSAVPDALAEAELKSVGEVQWRISEQVADFGSSQEAHRVLTEIAPGLRRCATSEANTDSITVRVTTERNLGDEAVRVRFTSSLNEVPELLAVRRGDLVLFLGAVTVSSNRSEPLPDAIVSAAVSRLRAAA